MGEFDLIARYFTRPPALGPRRARLGVGDDCALLDVAGTLAVSTDMLVEGRHFFADVDAEALGHKALAVNLSDLAAMGAQPLAYTLALALPPERAADEAWLAGFSRGLFGLGDRHGCELVGGDTTAGPLTISITIFGTVAPELALRRAGACVGDDVYVSGTLGDAALALQALLGQASTAASDLPGLRLRLERPEPRVGLGLALRGLATSAIDISDGLAGDLGHVLDASRVGAIVDVERIPMSHVLAARETSERLRCALGGGDDYELCFTAAPRRAHEVRQAGAAVGVAVTRIGSIVARTGLQWRLAGQALAIDMRGYDHFSQRDPFAT